MKQKPLFYEKQKFNQWWLWLLILIANTAGIVALFKAYQENAIPKPIMISFLIFVPALLLLFYFISLETILTKEGVSIRFFPFIPKEKHFPFREIQHFEILKYKPILDYGGWGVRYGRRGKAYNISGNMGMLIHFKNNKKLLIGTQKPNELKRVLETILHSQPSNETTLQSF